MQISIMDDAHPDDHHVHANNVPFLKGPNGIMANVANARVNWEKAKFACADYGFLLTLKMDLLHWSVLCFSAELIYEEVIDWEERNKNGLMKEDCSGSVIINFSIEQEETDKPPVKAPNFRSTGSFMCLL